LPDGDASPASGASGGQIGEISNGQGDRPWEQLEDRRVPADSDQA
jgi:hypothetical protein